MNQNAKCVEVRSADGKLMFSLHLYNGEMGADQKAGTSPGRHPRAESQTRAGGSGQNDSSLMTDAQKRYLFRILADQGFEEEKAYGRLKELLSVETLKEVTKREASRLIEELLEAAESR